MLEFAILDTWVRANAEAATYLAFFGLLLGFGILEALVPQSRTPARRLRRWSTNAVLATSWIVTGAMLPLSLLAVADVVAHNHWGLLALVSNPMAAFGLGILGRSLISYGTHVAMHKVPWLWRLHRVHHLDTQLDVSTTARFHPLEALVAAPFAIIGVVILGVPPAAVLLYEVIDAALVVFGHANVRLPNWLDRGLRLIIVTPNMHRIHHSTDQLETDSNFGATFSFWDRLFGTYRSRPASELADMKIGLDEVRGRRADSVLWLAISPLLKRPSADDER
jgi:sterol desaturase/sphingolipid hydroxylase (fatty acid hydroxylase superfamily)